MYTPSEEIEQTVPATNVQEGDIMRAKPKYFEPRPLGTGNIGQHPVIVLTNPDAYGRVQITSMSHSHPNNPPTKPASTYGLPVDPVKGESTVNVGVPYMIHVNHLRANVPHTRMDPFYFAELRNEIWRNSSAQSQETSTSSQ